MSRLSTSLAQVLLARSWLPDAIGGQVWFAPHAAHTNVYTPFPCGLDTIPPAYTWEGGTPPEWAPGAYDESKALWAMRSVFNIAQIKFSFMILDIRAKGDELEAASLALQGRWDAKLASVGPGGQLTGEQKAAMSAEYVANANATVAAWWNLSHTLIGRYGEGFCNDCGHGPRHAGYPAWWLTAVNYSRGRTPHAPRNPPSLGVLSRDSALSVGEATSGSSGTKVVTEVKGCVAACGTQGQEHGQEQSYGKRCVDACLALLEQLENPDVT